MKSKTGGKKRLTNEEREPGKKTVQDREVIGRRRKTEQKAKKSDNENRRKMERREGEEKKENLSSIPLSSYSCIFFLFFPSLKKYKTEDFKNRWLAKRMQQ